MAGHGLLANVAHDRPRSPVEIDLAERGLFGSFDGGVSAGL